MARKVTSSAGVSSFGRAIVIAALASVSVPALAQESAAPPAAAEDAGSAPPQDNAPAESIVVTGSRVVTNGNNSPTTVAVVTADQLIQTTPTNVADALRKLPQFSASTSQANTQGNAGAFTASSFLNLRMIGAVRNLVLFDGNRLVPSSPIGAVDLNTIPQMLIQRVDVVTGGVSAVYGSDAVSGVVNFVIDKKFNGVKALAQAGVSERGDNGTQRVGLAAGTSFAGDRGHIEASVEYFNSDGIASNKSRKNGAARYTATGAGTAANPFRLTSDSRLGALFSFGGHVLFTTPASAFADTNFSTDGVLTPFRHGTATGTGGTESGGEGGFYESSLFATLRTKQGYLRADYALTDALNVHAQGFYTEADSVGTYIQPLITGTLSASNGFLSPALRSQLAAAGVSTFFLAKFQESQPFVVQDTNARNIFGNVGFDGKLGSRFNWTVDYAHNESRRLDLVRGNQNQARTAAALDAVLAPASFTGSNFLLNSAGQKVVCNVTLTNPGLYPDCLPLNVFGPTSEDPTAEAFTRATTRNVLTQKQDQFAATLAGALFSLPAGDVRLALSGEYRRVTLVDNSSNQPTALANCTGLRFNCTATTTEFREAVTANSRGKVTVKEGGAEILIPVLADAPFARSLNLNAAARYTDYSTSGSVTTWKVGVDWHVTDDLSFRGTRSRDIRAPTVTELFGSQQIARSGFSDLQTAASCAAQPVSSPCPQLTNFVTGGNPNLVPEKANTYTIGAIYKPHWLPGFSVAVDYFNLKISNAIQGVDGRDVTIQRQCINSNFTSPFCDLYVRPISASDTSAANYPTQVFSRNINVARLKTHGVDVDVIYNTEFFGGKWDFRVLGTYQPTFSQSIIVGAPVLNGAGVDGLPKYRVTGFLGYSRGAVSIDTQTTWHSATKHSADPTIVYAYGKTPAKAFTDLTVTVDVPTDNGVKPQFFVTVNNLFDTSPGIFPAIIPSVPGFGPIATNGDDPVGRYFTAGFRARF